MPIDLEWLLQQPSSVQTTKPPVPELTVSGVSELTRVISYGQGLLAPMRRDGKGDFAHAADALLVRSNLQQVLHTVCSSGSTLGEIQWRPEFGSLLQLLRFRNMDETTIELARTYVLDALKLWLPRIRVKRTTVEADYDLRLLTLTVFYDILTSTRRSVLLANVSDKVAVPVAA